MKLRALIVEDEPLARGRLQDLLESEPDVEIIDACKNGKEALQVVQSSSPNVIFLDVQMPEMDGFAFLQAIPPASRPVVIIVTGDEKHAMRAFDIHAVDFLLKPFDRERLRTTLRRARERLQSQHQSELHELIAAMQRPFTTAREAADRIPIKEQGRIVFLKLDEIDWIGSAGNYIEIHTRNATHLLLATLASLETRLPSETFVRVSRSAIINAKRLKELRFDCRGQCLAVLHGGVQLPLSPKHRKKLEQLFGS